MNIFDIATDKAQQIFDIATDKAHFSDENADIFLISRRKHILWVNTLVTFYTFI